jgi:hypothetical protein
VSARSTLGSFVGFVGAALRPLADDLATPEGVLALLADVGVVVDDAPAAVVTLEERAEAVRSAHDALLAADAAGELEAALSLSGAVAELTAGLTALGPALVDELGTPPDQPALVDAGRRLLDRLLVDAAAIELPRLAAALRLGGILDVGDDPTPLPPGPVGTADYPVDLDAWSSLDPPTDPDNYVRPVPDWDEPALEFPVTRRRTLRTDRLRGWFDDPAGVPGDAFGWGSASFDGLGLLRRLEELLQASGMMTTLGARSDLEAVAPPDDPPPAAAVLEVPVYAAAAEHGTVEVGVVLAPLGPSALGGADAGVALTPRVGAATEFDFPLSPATALVIGGDMDLSGAVRIAFRPGGAQLELDPYVDGDGALGGEPTATLRHSPAGGLVLLAQAGLVTVTVDALALTLGLEESGVGLVPSVGAALNGGRLELAPGDADNFLRSVLPAASAPFELGLTWTQDSGFRLQGGSGLAVILPIDADLGPVRLDALAVAIAADGTDGLALSAALTAAVTLGPIVATVEGIGLGAAARVAEAGGNLGPLQLDPLRFVPPTGLGLAVDIERAASGGGFLALDADEGRYTGAAQLEILGVGLEAVGVLLTQLPAGGEAWSLFLSLSARFTHLQLGFGFTLNGVGGLVGVNRGVDEDALGAAIRSGALSGVLFPEDPIADAPTILDAIESVFPPIGGQYVIGPVVQIGWGTPTLVEVDAGVAIQLPEPLTVSLLGALSAVLPREDLPILDLHVDIAATANLTEGTLRLDASLTGSHVAGLLLTGDMAARASLLDAPTLLVAFGGFHPAFTPPADFPELDGVSVALDTGDTLRIGLGGYFALASNSVQVGARLDLWAGAEGFTIEGGTRFDALLVLDPFGFAIRLRIWVSVTAADVELLGVLLSGKLSGPNPWRVSGVAEFRLLGLRQRFELDESFGAAANEGPPERADVGQLVRDAVDLEDAWAALPPAGPDPVVVADPGEELAVHPSGRVQVLQHVVPLAAQLDCYGAAELVGPSVVDIEAVGFEDEDVEDVSDWFASAQFFALEDAARLSAPSFTLLKAGVIVGGSGVDAPAEREAVFDHEVAYRDPAGRPEGTTEAGVPVAASDAALARALAGRRSPTRTNYTIAEPGWLVADPSTGRSTGAGPAGGTGFFAARAAQAAQPDLPSVLKPTYELEHVS